MGSENAQRAKFAPPRWARSLPMATWGLHAARDLDEAYRAWVLNLYACLFVVFGAANLGWAVVHRAPENAAAHAVGIFLLTGLAELNRRGQVARARRLLLVLAPLSVLFVVGAGLAHTGSYAFLPVLALLPVALMDVPNGRQALAYGVLVSIGGAVATYTGLAHPLVAPPPSTSLPLDAAWIVLGGALAVLTLAQVASTRQAQMRSELEGAHVAARAADTTREALLAVVSHELRTPVAAALGVVEDVTRSGLPEEANSLLGEARNLLRHELSLLSDLLDLVALRAGELAVRRCPTRIASIVAGAARAVGASAASKGLSLSLRVDPELGVRVSDPDRISQILRHLTVNAVRFTERGRVEIRAATDGPDHVLLEVTDTGPGLSQAQIRDLAAPFTQEDMGVGRRHQGLGLGLSLVRALTTSLGASLHIDTPSVGGTRIAIRLPAPTVIPPAPPPDKLASWSVLIVDDLALNRRLLSRLVHRLGATRVYEAADGAEALQQWEKHRPRLVLMDMQMPGIDGTEATRRLRATGCEALVVAVTANVTAHAETACLNAGMNAYLTKPVRAQDILRVIAEHGVR